MHVIGQALEMQQGKRLARHRMQLLASAGLVGLTLLSSGTALAQTGQPVETVIIYGAKNATTLADTAASLGIVTAKDIDDRALLSFREAFRTMGNVMDGDWADAGFVIRGVNSEGLTPGGASLASLYVDGAQQTVNGARRGARGLWDVEQVEVYRGPQSTLSGRASLAGAIYVKTKDPTFETEAAARATFGSLDQKGGAFAYGGALIEDQVAFRIAGEYSIFENDVNYPTYQNFKRYDEFVQDEYYQFRGKLLVNPAGIPNTTGLLTYSFSHDSPFIKDIAGPVLGFALDQRRGDFNPAVFAEARSSDTHNVSFDASHDFNSALKLTSLTTYSFNDTGRPSVNEGTPGETEVTAGAFEQQLFTQELRLNYDEGAWKAVFGVYYASENNDAGFTRFAFGRRDISTNTGEAANMALFGEAIYAFADGWKIVVGGRGDYTDESATAFFSRNGAVTINTRTSTDEFVFLPKVGVVTDIGPGHSLGFIAQQGFRTGGQSVQRSTGLPFTYNSEFTWNYELSYKARLTEIVQLNANIFYTDWTDQQIETLTNPADFASSIIVNAANSNSYGFELETKVVPSPEFSAFLSIGYVKSEFENFVHQTLGNLNGFPFPEAPEWNTALGATYTCGCGLTLGTDAKFTSNYLGRLQGAPHEYVDSRWLANAQIGYRAEHWEVMFFVQNLFDKEYFVYREQNLVAGALRDVAATEGEGRTFAVNLTARL